MRGSHGTPIPPQRMKGLRRALAVLVSETRGLARHHLSVAADTRRIQLDRPLKLNLGSGRKLKAGWVNVDAIRGADLRVDLREPLPLPDGCAEIVYSEHFFEHLSFPGDAESFLGECRRVLRPGGRLSLGVPDAEAVLREYVSGRYELLDIAREWWHPAWCRTRLDQVNYLFRQDGEHGYAYDSETLAERLTAAGFASPRVRAFDPALDSEERRLGTLYMDARRPE